MKVLHNASSKLLLLVAALILVDPCQAFIGARSQSLVKTQQCNVPLPSPSSFTDALTATGRPSSATACLRLFNNDNEGKDEATIEEEARLRIWESRRGQIRSTLKSAENLRNFRLKNGFVPEIDEETGKPVQSDGKFALSATAFVVAFGAILLRVGGRAALINTLGLDFLTENQELQTQMNQVLEFSDSMDIFTKLGLFSAAWTVVKVSCFDAGAIPLALSSGILFGGVIQGAVVSAFSATIGSSVAFSLAKMDTPVRKKALELVDDNPSLRGIEKVVAKDGLKAILTLRLAPVLPIPIGFYNYVYGVTNVPYLDFAGGIFLGSMKPYLLDSYLGYFGKSLIDGSAANDGGLQDVILLVALGISVLVGVFATQLASETWDSVLDEVEEDERLKKEEAEENGEIDDGIVREVFGITVPDWIVGFQLALQEADERMNGILLQEVNAEVWNYTDSKGNNPVPRELNPAFDPSSPEIVGSYGGINFGPSICDGLVLSPMMFSAFLKYADPLYTGEDDGDDDNQGSMNKSSSSTTRKQKPAAVSTDEILDELSQLRQKTQERIKELDERLEKENTVS